ncbi:MAG TPA: flagellar filament capping protein FliD [Acidimicrobiales bacterium]|nr:flagellar filament capping protein FliD [Acidimicrobiales bacterium]
MANSSVDGLVSGLNTSQIIDQLMSIEKQPQQQLQLKKADNNNVIGTYQSINSLVASMRAAAQALNQASTWNARTATSSSSAVTAAATPDALTGAMTFDVTSVAKAQSYVYGTTVASTAVVVADGNLTITKGNGAPVTVNVGDGTLASVINAINTSNAGVRAAAVQTGAGVRLQLTSTTTGAASDFTVAGLTVGGTSVLGSRNVLVAASDAVLTVGPGSPGQYTITSSTNTLAPMPGLTLTVSAPATGVTVSIGRNDNSVADAVQRFVDATNAALNEIKKDTAYDAENKKGAILLGDSMVTSLQQQLLQRVSAAVGGSSPATVGISLQRDGTISFNRDTFLAKLGSDPDGTAKMFEAGATATDSRVTFLTSTARTSVDAVSPYAVAVTAAATQASARLSIVGAVDGSTTLSLTVGGQTFAVAVQPGDTAADLVNRINATSTQNGIGLTAQVDSGDVLVKTAAYGTAPTFTMSASNGLSATATTAGTDVAGTINGVAATGKGQVLTSTATGPANGLSLRISATAAEVAGAGGNLSLGTVTYRPGIAQRLDSAGYWANDSVSGSISSAITGRRSENASIDEQISDWDVRLALKEQALRLQFTNLETALGKLKNQSSWLSGQLAGLSGGKG